MRFYYLAFMALLFSCTQEKTIEQDLNKTLDIQGHRGCRGHYPENTITGMIKAIDMGVTTLEMDVVISKDKQVIVSHEPFLSHEICLDSLGNQISKEEEMMNNIYKLNYAQIANCDCGTKQHPLFPDQLKAAEHKPLLSDLIDSVELYIKKNDLEPVFYNIETKSRLGFDSIFHPAPSEFIELLMEVVEKKKISKRVIIQSFDVRTLQILNRTLPEIKTALLVEQEKSYTRMIDSLGFKPAIYSCDFTLLDKQTVLELQKENIAIIPWTVNETADIKKLLAWGVDGIISDYPNRVKAAVN